TRDFADTAVIGLVVLVNSFIGLRQELRADRSVSELSRLVAPKAWAVRAGRPVEVPAVELVPGDVVLLRQGDLVPADGVLIEGAGVQVDESTMTGEAYPVDKAVAADPGPNRTEDTEPARTVESTTALFSGTLLLHGRGRARITATGARSAVGRIASLMAPAPGATPLQRRMTRLSGQLAITAILLSAVVLLVGLWRGQSPEVMLLTTIALIVAAVPESLPLVVTVSLALAARRMASRHAVVRTLSAVETLGSVTVLATDKTGTLTRGSMTVTDIWHPDSVEDDQLMRAITLCNDATIGAEPSNNRGDPTERALLVAALASGVDIDAVRAANPRVAEVPFDSTRKAMSTTHGGAAGRRLLIHKGAPERLLAGDLLVDSPELIDRAQERADTWASGGMRVIAVAQQELDPEVAPDTARRANLLGLVGLQDPLRDSSADTVAACQDAGLHVVLVTGDHPATAQAIATQVGIVTEKARNDPAEIRTEAGAAYALRRGVVARATPADKHALVKAFQASGQVVAMTGDGVNDAPALRQADIGVAMGVRGTQVARQAADLVLMDDDLGTVVAAVEEGRRVYDNVRRFLVYALSGGTSEVMLMLAGPVVGVPLPLLPAQILWVNLLTHSFAGAGLAAQPADPEVLRRGPRPPDEGPLARGLWWRTLVLATYLSASSAAVMLFSPAAQAHSAALLALGAGQLAIAWGVRTAGARIWHDGRPDVLVPALLLAATMLAASATVAPLRQLLDTRPVSGSVWAMAAAAAAGAYATARLLRARSL
ncbi:MAG TPA: cation-transporting P-type ATPase, partial [Pedococcus sp.]|nr:cation-transporting P-type ATPase [Pedococcus sp.]